MSSSAEVPNDDNNFVDENPFKITLGLKPSKFMFLLSFGGKPAITPQRKFSNNQTCLTKKC